ncbi:hypothetical protein M569_08485 [Genlisea aurea]|uniref:Uncharacterized protein n=1 Tax=Genlisea aurea TaxID=192259 RepID=S8E1V5_9LAMI|nr:hypothetical protein M569_08485 [Genlisea aurea]
MPNFCTVQIPISISSFSEFMEAPEVRSKSSRPIKRNSAQLPSLQVSDNSSSTKTSPRYLDPTISSSNLATKTKSPRFSDHGLYASSSSLIIRAPKERNSPRFSDHGLPVHKLSEEKNLSRFSEFESEIFRLENELENVKNQLVSSEISKKKAQKDAEESRKQLIAMYEKIDESQNRVSESPALVSALDEIESLKAQLKLAAESEAEWNKKSQSNQKEIKEMRAKLEETCSILEEIQRKMSEAKRSEAQSKESADEKLMQLERAKLMVDALKTDGCETTKSYDIIASELEESRARAAFLEELVSELKASVQLARSQREFERAEKRLDEEVDAASIKLEVQGLKSALEAAGIRCNDELIRREEDARSALDFVEAVKSGSEQRQDELEAEILSSRDEINQLTANLLDMEAKLQGIRWENAGLMKELDAASENREQRLESELSGVKNGVGALRARLAKREADLENAAVENESLKSDIRRRGEEEAERADRLREEVEKTNRKVVAVIERLEMAERENLEMEGELRRLRVQSEQWRKAAEVAASILSAGGGQHRQFGQQAVGRTGSMDGGGGFSPPARRRMSSSYGDDETTPKKRNGNLLRKLGLSWKK